MALLLLLAALAASVPRPASAYVREVTSTGVPLAWKNPCIEMHLFLGDTPPVLTADQFLEATTLAASAWSQPFLACSDIRLTVVPDARPTVDVAFDHTNVIVFRRQAWCASASPEANPGTSTCYSASALAVTTVTKNKNSGEILDADIAINAVNYTWGDLVAYAALAKDNTVDFQNTVTHELGHVIGLDHSCYSPADDQPRLMDNTGQPEVDCYGNPALPESIADSTMYPSVSVKDTLRRDLSPDDQQGDCDIYPYLHAECPAPSTDGGCSTLASQSPPGGPTQGRFLTVASAGLLAAVLVWARRRRTRRI